MTNQQTSRTFLCSGRGMPTSNGPRANRTSCKLPCSTKNNTFCSDSVTENTHTHTLEHLESELTCRNKVHRHSRQTLRHIAQSRTPIPATQAQYKPFLVFFFTGKQLDKLQKQQFTQSFTIIINVKLPCSSVERVHANRPEERVAISKHMT